MLLYFLPQLFFFTTQNNPHFVTATALVGTIVAVVVAALVSTAAGSSFSTERIYPYVKCQNGRTYNIQHPK